MNLTHAYLAARATALRAKASTFTDNETFTTLHSLARVYDAHAAQSSLVVIHYVGADEPAILDITTAAQQARLYRIAAKQARAEGLIAGANRMAAHARAAERAIVAHANALITQNIRAAGGVYQFFTKGE